MGRLCTCKVRDFCILVTSVLYVGEGQAVLARFCPPKRQACCSPTGKNMSPLPSAAELLCLSAGQVPGVGLENELPLLLTHSS